MPPPTEADHLLTDAELDDVGAGFININVTGPNIANDITVQTNVANQIANSIFSSATITQLIGQVNVD